MLRRISEQSNSVENYYRHTNQEMLEVIKHLDEELGSKVVFCLTSHYRLVLVNQDDHATPWWVIITPPNQGETDFDVSCIIPERFAPWDNARAHGTVKTPQEAARQAILGIDYSEGWTGANLEINYRNDPIYKELKRKRENDSDA